MRVDYRTESAGGLGRAGAGAAGQADRHPSDGRAAAPERAGVQPAGSAPLVGDSERQLQAWWAQDWAGGLVALLALLDLGPFLARRLPLERIAQTLGLARPRSSPKVLVCPAGEV